MAGVDDVYRVVVSLRKILILTTKYSYNLGKPPLMTVKLLTGT